MKILFIRNNRVKFPLNNHLFTGIICSIIFISSIGLVSADVIAPNKQAALNFTPEEIICKEDLVKLIKKSNGKAACVEPSSAEKLAGFGWATPLSEETKSEIITKKGKPAGTVNPIMTLNQVAPSGRLDSTPRINSFNYVFEICAGEKNIRAPEIVVTSDSEVKSIKLASMMNSGQCRTISVSMKANNPESISAVLLNKGGITKTIMDLELKLDELQNKLRKEKELLSSTSDPKKISETNQKIVNIRKEINSKRYELNKYNLFLFSDPKKPTPLPQMTSFAGKPIEGLSSEIISVRLQDNQPRESERIINYGVVFEACTANQLVRIPLITVSSDTESKQVKIAEKISPNTCQMSAVTIFAKDLNSISVSISDNQSSSDKILEIENKINELNDQLGLANKSLTNLLSSNLSEDQLAKELTSVTTKISDLRSKILAKKSEMAAIMLQIYR